MKIIDPIKPIKRPWWIRVLLRIPLIGWLFRRRIRFKRVEVPIIKGAEWPKIDLSIFEQNSVKGDD